jgi:ABC-type multidrug transport system fused ATPase/permease subunit
MNEDTGYDFYRSFFAVLAGVLSAIATGFIIKKLFEKLFHFDPLGTLSPDEINFMVQLAATGWLFVSSLVGGFVCARIAGRNDLSHIIVSSLVVLALYFFLGGTEMLKDRSILSWAILLAIPIGIFLGEWIGSIRKNEET